MVYDFQRAFETRNRMHRVPVLFIARCIQNMRAEIHRPHVHIVPMSVHLMQLLEPPKLHGLTRTRHVDPFSDRVVARAP
jgi:hypothetical protein